MAKRKTRKNKKTNTTVIGFVLLLALAVGVTVLVLSFITPKKKSDGKDEPNITTNVESTKPVEKQPAEEQPEEPKEETKEDDGESENQQTPAQYEKVKDETASDAISATVTHSSIDNRKFVLRLTINELVKGSGNCLLYMVSGNKKYNDKVEIVSDPTSSTCAGFDVDIAKLSSGTWNYTVTITSGKRTGKVEGKITI